MATETAVKDRVDHELEDLEAEVSFLPELAKDWEKEHRVTQISATLEWSNLMGGLKFLDWAFHSSQMTLEQRGRYRALLRKLKEALPTIKKLGFTVPSVSLDT